MPSDAPRLEPDPSLAELDDEAQVEILEPTDNGLGPDDPPEDEQPPQDPDWRPDGQ